MLSAALCVDWSALRTPVPASRRELHHAHAAEARRLAKSGGLYVNNNRVDQGSRVESEDVLAGAGCLLRTGRRKYFLARIQ